MDIIVKPVLDDLSSYIKQKITNFLLPLENFSVEYTNYYSLDQIKSIKKEYPNINLFIVINKNIQNRELISLENILLELDKINVKGIFFYDLALLNLKNKLKLKVDLVWNQTHMVTNYRTCNYYYSKGVKYALLSKEITKDEIIEIANNSSIIPIVELIGYPTVAFSKRKLVTNYYIDSNQSIENNIDIIEPKTKQKYYLRENSDGVSFIMKKLTNGSYILKDLIDNNIEYILLKEDLIEHDIFIECISNTVNYINNYKTVDFKQWLNKQSKLLGRNTNFLYRKTIYKVK